VKVVFDSNVYVSALAIPGGVAERALRAAIDGAFELAISRPILTEVLEVLSRKFARDAEQLARTALFLSSVAEMVAPARRVRVLMDDPDNRILECALAARADIIVTGDRQMLALSAWEGVELVTLRRFVDRFAPGGEVREPRARYRARRSKALGPGPSLRS
jgi:putative PIN family toxin of toxin-antitoxin system